MNYVYIASMIYRFISLVPGEEEEERFLGGANKVTKKNLPGIISANSPTADDGSKPAGKEEEEEEEEEKDGKMEGGDALMC